MSDCTSVQLNVLHFLAAFQRERGFMPARHEISKHFGWRSNNAGESQVRALERKGYLEVEDGIPRGIRFTPKAREVLGMQGPQISTPPGGFIGLPVVDPAKVGRGTEGGR